MSNNNILHIENNLTKIIIPDSFNENDHFYECVLKKKIHKTVEYFFSLTKKDYVELYCKKYNNKTINKELLYKIFSYHPKYFHWSGVDLLNVNNFDDSNINNMLILETNSCPSGQKSMPNIISGLGYENLMKVFMNIVNDLHQKNILPDGSLAVIYDKNYMEVSGYAKKLATISNENIYLVESYNNDINPSIKWDNDGIMYIRDSLNTIWIKIRAVFRYVTQQPWNRIPINSKTFVFNSILSCIAGGRNKLLAHKAYEELNNNELLNSGLKIRIPYTICDVTINEIDLIIKNMNYRAVIKIPYSNAGQGVFTIHTKNEYDICIKKIVEIKYEKFIIQELVDSIGTIPLNNDIYVWDLRFMINSSEDGFKPLALYARKAENPLISNKNCNDIDNILWSNISSRKMYLTNLSEKIEENKWNTSTERLIILDEENFEKLGINLEDLIDGYIQAVLATIAIDKMACKLWCDENKTFNKDLFNSLNNDIGLENEMYIL
jgi:hypothetical protein